LLTFEVPDVEDVVPLSVGRKSCEEGAFGMQRDLGYGIVGYLVLSYQSSWAGDPSADCTVHAA